MCLYMPDILAVHCLYPGLEIVVFSYDPTTGRTSEIQNGFQTNQSKNMLCGFPNAWQIIVIMDVKNEVFSRQGVFTVTSSWPWLSGYPSTEPHSYLVVPFRSKFTNDIYG